MKIKLEYEIRHDVNKGTVSIYNQYGKCISAFWPDNAQGFANAEKHIIKIQLKKSTNPLVKLWLMLESHDWYYAYSDDMSKYRAGQSSLSLINQYVKNNNSKQYPLFKMFTDYTECRNSVEKQFNIEDYIDVEYEIKVSNVEVY